MPQHNIIPAHAQITIKQNTHAALQTKRKAENIYLNNIINDLYRKKDTLNKLITYIFIKICKEIGRNSEPAKKESRPICKIGHWKCIWRKGEKHDKSHG